MGFAAGIPAQVPPGQIPACLVAQANTGNFRNLHVYWGENLSTCEGAAFSIFFKDLF